MPKKYVCTYYSTGRKQLRFKRSITGRDSVSLQDLIDAASKELPGLLFNKIVVLSDADDIHDWQNTILEEPQNR